jgi:hypothetical protein
MKKTGGYKNWRGSGLITMNYVLSINKVNAFEADED